MASKNEVTRRKNMLTRKREFGRSLRIESLESRHMLASDWTNPLFHLDVNDDSDVNPLDVLVVINEINAYGSRKLTAPFGGSNGDSYLDTDGDGFVAPLDILLVINSINAAIPIPATDLRLSNDSGASSTDSLTNDPRTYGAAVAGDSTIVSAKARVNRGMVVPLIVDASGAFQFDPRTLQSLEDGPKRISVAITLASGATGLRQLNFTYDATPPSFEPPRLRKADDTGFSDGDNVTKVNNPHLEVHAESGSRLQVQLDGQTLVNQISTGSWESQLSSLSDGQYEVFASASDIAGNVSQTLFPVIITIDTVAPPTIQLDLAPTSDTGAKGDRQTGAARVGLNGTTEGNALVTLVGQTQVVRATNDGSFRFQSVPLGSGGNVFTTNVVDLAGNIGPSSQTVLTRIVEAGITDPILRWNSAALEAIRLDASTPLVASRNLAMLSQATFDVVNAVDGNPSLVVGLSAPLGLSPEAAVSSAAYEILKNAYPSQQAALEQVLNAALAEIADGPSKLDGIAFGQLVARTIIALRSEDGWNTFAEYTPQETAGRWQETAPMYSPALLPQWKDMQPFGIANASTILSSRPPELFSSTYSTAFQEVALLGRANSSVRTADQTQIARFWADGAGTTTPPGHWNAIAGQVAQSFGSSWGENARLFAELNTALGDAAIVAWDAKYKHEFWRPITAIQQAELDNNTQTVADSDWSPLLISPPFPEYVSGHSTFSGAAAKILSAEFGESISFTTNSPGLPDVQRTFTSFEHAAQEAGRSRIYGGIHFEFSNQDGQLAGRAVADEILALFSKGNDLLPPKIVFESLKTGLLTNTNPTIRGWTLDNLSGVRALQASMDGRAYVVVNLDSNGRFSFQPQLALNGSNDGMHTVTFRAIDHAGLISPVAEFKFTLDTTAPNIDIVSPLENAVISVESRLVGTAGGTGSPITSLTYQIGDGVSMPIRFASSNGRFDQRFDLSELAPGIHTIRVTARDAAGNVSTTSVNARLVAAIPLTIAAISPTTGESAVGTTVRPKINFSRPINVNSLNASNLYATGPDGEKLPATIVPASDGSFAWLFFANPMPSGAVVTLHVDGSTILAADGVSLDANGDGLAGGMFESSFRTVSLMPLLGTSLTGKVLDPGPDLSPMTFDDIRAGVDQTLHTADDVFLAPLAGVKVFILGMEDRVAVTDTAGNFRFDSVPAGNVKLAIDGRSATNAPAGIFFPEMVMDLNLRAGQANTTMGTMGILEQQLANLDRQEVYLPRLRTNLLKPLNQAQQTVVTVELESAPGLTPEQRSRLSITVPPGKAIGHDGQPIVNGQLGISTVPPELVRDMLPPGLLQHTFDITIQAPGIDRFTEPVPMTFPNLMGSAPGSQLNFLSFDHTTGRLVIEGTATVSSDGLTASTDPGTGITHPGWHGLTPPGTQTGGGSNCLPSSSSPPTDVKPIPVTMGVRDFLFTSDDGGFTLSFGNAASGIVPSLGACAEANVSATPMVVNIEINGPAELFLTGLVDQEFTLLPQQQKSLRIEVNDLLSQIKEIHLDQFYSANVRIRSWQLNRPNEILLDQTMFVSRFVDASDSNHVDATIEFIDTLNDGPSRVLRTREFELFGPRPLFDVLSQNFGLAGPVGQVNGFIFDPILTGPDLSTTLQVLTPQGNPIPDGTLLLTGQGTPKNIININRFGLDTILTRLGSGLESNNITEPLLVTSVERKMLDEPTERAAIIDAVANKVSAYFSDVSSGIEVQDNPSSLNSVFVSWKNDTAIDRFGDSKPGGGIDAAVEIQNIKLNRDRWNRSELVFRFSNAVNKALASIVEVYVDNHLEWQLGGDGGTPASANQPLNLSVEELVNALAFNVAHEVAHTLGLPHVAQGTPPTTKVGEIQRITLSGGGPNSEFSLTFDGVSTPMLDKNATGSDVERVLLNLSNLSRRAVNVKVTGPNGGPYLVEFIGLLQGTDVPELGHAETDGLSVSVVTTRVAQSLPDIEKNADGSKKLVTIGSLSGKNDVMYGGNLDMDGNARFQSGLTLEMLKLALKTDFSLDEALTALDYVTATFASNSFSSLSSGDGGEETPPIGPFLGVRDVDNRLVRDSIDFGTITVDGKNSARQDYVVRFSNFGTEDVILNSVHIEDEFGNFVTNRVVQDVRVSPGSIVPLTLSFDPLISGVASAMLVIDSNDASSQRFLKLSGFGLASSGDIRIDDIKNNFGGIKTSAGSVMLDDSLLIRNIGTQPLAVHGVQFISGNEFTVTGLPLGFGINQPLVIGPGGSYSLSASFDPSTVGLRRGVLEILSDDPETPLLRKSFVGTGLSQTGSALDYGNDYVAVETFLIDGAPAFRQRSDDGGTWSFFLPNNEAIHSVLFDPVSGLISHAYDVTRDLGQPTELLAPVFLASTAYDTDEDGLPDDIEFAVGTGLNVVDSDKDGLSDFVEIMQGLDPLGGLGLPTGIVSAVDLQGAAMDVQVEGSLKDSDTQTAFVATGPYGLAIVDVTRPTEPIVLSELNLVGNSVDVAVDRARNIALLAAGTAGIHIANIANASSPSLQTSIPVGGIATRIELFGDMAYVAVGNSIVSIDLETRTVSQTLQVSDLAITDLAIESNTLFTLDEGSVLRAIGILGSAMSLQGSLSFNSTYGKLTVGGDIAYIPVKSDVSRNVGFMTVDVSDPDNLVLISDSDSTIPFGRTNPDFAITGSGLGLYLSNGDPSTFPFVNVLDVYVVKDSSNTNAFVTRIPLTGVLKGVSIGNGFAYVANDSNGLQIVNFQPLDTEGQSPETTISTLDRDPTRVGIQVSAGDLITIQSSVLDDVLVRNVELLVNGDVVRNDASFPWDFLVPTLLTNQPSTLLIQVRATDTGGNTGLSNLLTIEVVPDTLAPQLIETIPSEGQRTKRVEQIDLKFDQALNTVLLALSGVHLTNLGPDNLPGGGDDRVTDISSIVVRDLGRTVRLVPNSELAEGFYRLVVDAAILSDLAGNHVSDSVVLNFNIPAGSAIRALTGFATDPELPSANPWQEIRFVMPWDPTAARLSYESRLLDTSGQSIRNNLVYPYRVDRQTRTAVFRLPEVAFTGDVMVYGGSTVGIIDLPNWNVITGNTAVVGRDIQGHPQEDYFPGNGLYLKLGALPNTPSSPLESKTEFPLTPGEYELKFDLAGSRVSTESVRVSLGSLFSEDFTRSPGSTFSTLTRRIVVNDATTARLVFNPTGSTRFGLFLDNVKLTRVDSGLVLLDDHFDLPVPNGTFPLQTVPAITRFDVTSISSDGSSAVVNIFGSGFVEGQNTAYKFGDVVVVDTSASSGPDVKEDPATRNTSEPSHIATLTLPMSSSVFGAINVTTPGGRSASISIGLSEIDAVAFSGTPANPTLPSANPGQSITLKGEGLNTSTGILVKYLTDNGVPKTQLLKPTFAGFDRKSAQVILPNDINGVVQVGVFGSANLLPLQIVPMLLQAEVIVRSISAVSTTRLVGRGLLEGQGIYDFQSGQDFDEEINDGPDVVALNTTVELNRVLADGTLVTVTTPGGKSAPVMVISSVPPELPLPTITNIPTVAADGVPNNNQIGSANAGQVIIIHGTNFRLDSSQFLIPTRNEEGLDGVLGISPLAVNDAGTAVQVKIPDLASTGPVRVTTIGSRNLGFAADRDAIHRSIELSFTPTSSVTELRFSDGGLAGLAQESWGLDNVQVSLGGNTLFSDNFEGATRTEWSKSTTSDLLSLGRFSGPVSNEVQTLRLTGLTPGQSHTLQFDLYLFDSWDGLDSVTEQDRFLVRADATTIFDKAFSNDLSKTQTFVRGAGIALQVVPTISSAKPSVEGLPGTGLSIFGTGFMEGAGTITIGGRALLDRSVYDRQSTEDNYDPNVRTGSKNGTYELVDVQAFTLDGPIRVTTAGGYFEIASQTLTSQPGTIRSIVATAARGTPLSAGKPSANTGQLLLLRGAFSGYNSSDSSLVIFEAVDDTGRVGTVARKSDYDPALDPSVLTVLVPETAITGKVRLLGSTDSFDLQIVPTLNGAGPLIPGVQTILEGTGLRPGDLLLTVDDQPVSNYTIRTVRDEDDFHAFPDRQLVSFTAPAGIGPGIIRAVTSGGTATLQAGVAANASPTVKPTTDVSDAIASAYTVSTLPNSRLTIDSELDFRPSPGFDSDVYRFDFQAGDQLAIDLTSSSNPDASQRLNMELLDAAGTEIGSTNSPFLGEYRIEYTVPISGIYYLRVFDRSQGLPAERYQAHVRRVGSDSTVLTGITSTANRGTPTNVNIGSANVGQVITLTGYGLRASDQVVFKYANPNNSDGPEMTVAPLSVSADGRSLTVRVPTSDPVTTCSIHLRAETVGVFLQIVPTLESMETYSITLGEQKVSLQRTGEDYPSTINVGNVVMHIGFASDPFRLSLEGIPLGPISLTTLGGTSAPFGPDMVSVEATATSGTPAKSNLPSANPGQTITVRGSGFAFTRVNAPATGLVFQVIDALGNRSVRVVMPTFADTDGTLMRFVVPADAVTGPVGVMGDLDGSMILLQIVPVVTTIVPVGTTSIRVTGKGLIEGDALYRIGTNEILDGSISSAGVNVTGFNTSATVASVSLGTGTFTVTTAGGTSAPINFGALKSEQNHYDRDLRSIYLQASQLQSIANEAISRYAAAGIDQEQQNRLQSVGWSIRDLPGAYLGFTAGNTIFIDRNAAGWGWFIDPSPNSDSEFFMAGNQGEQNHIDLLSVVLHELGHILELDHDEEGLMAPTLNAGKRHIRAKNCHDNLVDDLFCEHFLFFET